MPSPCAPLRVASSDWKEYSASIAGTPQPVIDRFHSELQKALSLPDVRKTLTEGLGMELIVSSPDVLQRWIVAEMERWSKVVKDNGIKAD